MSKVNFEELLEAGVHFGHLKRKWNPNMAPYIFMEQNGIHIIDLYKTQVKLEDAAKAMKQIAKSGRKVLFVATKKQAKELVAETVKKINMPYVTERWPGGMLTNFATIRKAVRKMNSIDKLMTTPSWNNLSKRERLQVSRERAKLEKNLGSISDMSRLPAALFIVDINKEKIAVAEARKLNIPTFAMVDTNTDPNLIDFPIPANDDASKSIALILNTITAAVAEGLAERQATREKSVADKKSQDLEGEEGDDEEETTNFKVKADTLKQAEEDADREAEKKEAAKKKAKLIAKKPAAAPKKKTEEDED
ncbi:MAG: 30S ribosomal protein S2 [Bacteroidales bacterium]|nr:30S ribosomal protein S2 [Bacteroidales bacterium]